MLSTVNLRFAHFPSRSPIMLELQVDPNTTVGQLRALVEERLATEDHCLVRVFARWYLEMRAGEVRRFSELTEADGGSLLSSVGIEDESELYLEGPVVEEENGMWKALAIVSMQGRQAQSQQSSLVQQLLSEIRSLKVTQAVHRDEIRSLRETLAKGNANQDQKLDKLAKQIEALVSAQEKQKEALVATQKEQQQQLDTIAAAQTKLAEDTRQSLTALHERMKSEIIALKPLIDSANLDRANSLLVKYSNLPLKALWEVLNDKESSVELAMAIVLDRRCGLERKSAPADGEMKGNNGWAFNKEKGGLTPLIMAALLGRLDVVKALLAAGADRDAKENQHNLSALIVAAYTNNPAAIELLVSYGVDVNPGGYSPLHQAAYNGNLEAIEMLIAKGADITKVNTVGSTPLKVFEQREKQLTWVPQEAKERIRGLLTPK